MRMSQPFAICSICSLADPLSMRSMGWPRAVHEIDETTRRSDEDVAAFDELLHVLLMRWPPRPWHSPATATGRVHLPSSPHICSGGAVANVDLGLDADAHAEVKLESGSGQSERGGNIVIVEVVEKVYLTSPPGVGVGNWGWGWVVGLFHRTIHLLNRKSTNSEAKLVQAGSQASVLLLAEEKSPTPPEPRRWNSPRQMEKSATTTTAAKSRGSTVKMANYVEPQTTTDKNESAVSVDYDALDDSPTAPFGEVRYYQDEYEEEKTSELQKPNSSKSQDNTRGSAQRPRVRSPIALRVTPLPVPTTRPITRPNQKASLLYRLTSAASTAKLAASLAYARTTVPVYLTNSNFDFEKLKALRRFKAVCGPHSRCERYQLSRDLAAIRPSSSGLQGIQSHACDWSRQKRPARNPLGRPSRSLLKRTMPWISCSATI
ncbi:hypothetical protein NEUTE2DRAFT_130354 [Neurospora tetrasperma FGSC 2509]|nr:hypothetical protein NEUTE2DRAFT_130354 [Neurospora tetrasperma FGSC 2509]